MVGKYIRTEQHRAIAAKIGAMGKGRPKSEEHKRKIALANTGKKFTAERLANMSASAMGQPAWNKGKKLPEFSGVNHPRWKGMPRGFKNAIRTSIEYKLWRTAIFQRDRYTCTQCGKTNCELNVDHYPKGFSQIIDEYNIRSMDEAIRCDALWDTKNNRTLCVDCHKQTDNYFHKSNSTRTKR